MLKLVKLTETYREQLFDMMDEWTVTGEKIGTQMIALTLEACKRRCITHVLMVCNRPNIASARTIQKNGGVLENEVVIDGEILHATGLTTYDPPPDGAHYAQKG